MRHFALRRSRRLVLAQFLIHELLLYEPSELALAR
jgi:hypothetical protein